MPASATPTTDQRPVEYGIKNVHYSVYDPVKGEYGDVKAWKGAKSLTTSPQGNTTTFYADDTAWFTGVKNSGYTGTITMVNIPDEIKKDLLGFVEDDGMLYEDASAVLPEFALMFEIDGNMYQQRGVFYNCKLTRPGLEHNTQEENITPDTSKCDITMTTRELKFKDGVKNIVKASVKNDDTGKTRYDAFYTKVQMPTVSTGA